MYIKYSVDEKLLLLLEFSVALKALFPGLLHEQIPRQSNETRRFALAYK